MVNCIMGCSGCREALQGSGTFAERIHKACADKCGCEKHSLSELSPGVVSDHEALHFVVSDPEGILDGGINPMLLQQVHSGGLSVLRENATTEEFVHTLDELTTRWADKARRFIGVASFQCSQVRYAKSDRLCCVFDTALPGKPHHADIVGSLLPVESRSATERLRKARTKSLVDAIGQSFEAATSFRAGALARFAEIQR
jgi:hypothetical protein